MAIVHEWIQARAGSEQTFEALAECFPHASLFALSHEPGVYIETGNRPIATTALDRPILRGHRAACLPLMPLAWRMLGSKKFDTVLSSHHAFAHTNHLARERHFVYVHSPARYIWTPEIDPRGSSNLLRLPAQLLRSVDRRASGRVTAYAANSREVAHRIRRFWNRDAVVIPPPVDVEFYAQSQSRPRTRDFILGVGRWIGYKNLHLVIEAASLAGIPAKIAGRGPERQRLEAAASAASVPVSIIESPSDHELRELYRNAAALVFPTHEDFGIVPVEAQAAGTPVVALASGGALDTVVDGESGVLVTRPDPALLADAIQNALALKAEDCRRSAQRFSRGAFARHIFEWMGEQDLTDPDS